LTFKEARLPLVLSSQGLITVVFGASHGDQITVFNNKPFETINNVLGHMYT